MARPGNDGRFRLAGVTPGDYFLVAVDVLDTFGGAGEWQDPTVLESLTRAATRVSLGEGQHGTYTLVLQHR